MLGGERRAAVCRELTKLHEEIWRGTLAEAQQVWQQREPRGEFTLVVAGVLPESSPQWSQAEIEAALTAVVRSGSSAKDAVKQVTVQSGWPKRDVFNLMQRIKEAIS